MNKSLQSWTPRARPLSYDSLQQDIGCQDARGNTIFASKPFTRICIMEHTAAQSSVFNRSDQISYTIGPAQTGDAMPWPTTWAAWVASAGIRIGKIPSITLPSNGLGSPSSLYPTLRPSKVSIGFTSNAQMALAVQKTSESIEIKWFADGTGSNIGTVSFLGVSPALFNNGVVHVSDDAGETDLVLYYLRSEAPRKIFARFERESFGVEHVVHDNLQTNVTSLIANVRQGRKHVLYARDATLRDITLSTTEYIPTMDGEAAGLSIYIDRSWYRESAVELSLTEEMTLEIGIVRGQYSDVIEQPASPLSGDKATLTLSILAGQYE